MPERFGFGGVDPFESEPDEEKDKKGISRRSFVKKAAALGAGAAIFGPKLFKEKAEAKPAVTEKFGEPKRLLENYELPEVDFEELTETKYSAAELEQNSLAEYATKELEGHYCGPFDSDVTGIPQGRIGKTVRINFTEHLKYLWKKKKAKALSPRNVRLHKSGKLRYSGFMSPAAEAAGKQMIEDYTHGNKGKTNFDSYLKHLERVVSEVKHKDLDWEKLVEILNLNKEQAEFFRKLAESISGKDIMAYSMTELMGSYDGELNEHYYAFILRNAGTRYLYSIPALSDGMASFGPYQLTSLAFWNDETNTEWGVARMNHAMKKNAVPVSMANVRGDDHHRAAYLYAIFNLGNLIRNLNSREFRTYSKNYNKHQNELVQYIATAHNAPGSALDAARKWIDNGMKLPYERSCRSNILDYALKSKNNLKHLKNR